MANTTNQSNDQGEYLNQFYLLFSGTLQNGPYFCVFKYAQAVKLKVSSEAESGERNLGRDAKNTLYSFILQHSHGQFPLAKF